jgi:methylated-DNA-[protein]-cysteine S-methyltransferase
MYKAFYRSPVGLLEIISDSNAITEISFVRNSDKKIPDELGKYTPPVIKQCIQELEEYFAGARKKFDVPCKLDGSDFQMRVWQELEKIPYGSTVTYAEQAQKLGDIKAIRAVGTANGKNKIAIIIPCHRVIGTNGSLTGYAGGIENKKWLLLHEQEHSDANEKGLLF